MEKKKIFMGLDLGTESCGWAVTDENYDIIKISGKHLHGVRKFSAADSAEKRRLKRSARRRLARRKFRIEILQHLFSKEITKVDPNFFLRLNNSFFREEDKVSDLGKYSLFNDKNFTDKQYFNRFKTIYHLRKYLIESNKKEDIRLVYLACHNIIKYRGNFLIESFNVDNIDDDYSIIINSFNDLVSSLNDYIGEEVYSLNVSETDIKSILKIVESTQSLNDQSLQINSIVNRLKSKDNKRLIELILGKTIGLNDLFYNDDFKTKDFPKIKFGDLKFETEVEPVLYDLVGDCAESIFLAKKIYNWIIVKNFLRDSKTISEAKIREYNEHNKDLKALKKFVRNNFSKAKYDEVFRISNNKVNNYASYVKTNLINNEKQYVHGCSYDEFIKYVKTLLTEFENQNQGLIEENSNNNEAITLYVYIKNKVNNMTFLPKQRISSNGVIPYQLHYFELSQILNNALNHYDFLGETDNTGINTIEKITKLMEFRIPYYIGPLNPAHKNDKSKFTWIERLEKGKVLPWNFEQKIDIDNTAEGFIKKMTRKCSYLKGKDVLPKNSLLYSEYSVLNELNNLHVNGQPLDKNLKQKIFKQLFKKKKKVTQKNIKDFLISESIFKKGDQIDLSGIDGDFKNSLSSFISFSRIFQDIDNDYELQKEIEKIIFILTIFENRDMAIKRISKEYSNITKDQLKEIKKLNFIGWGKLSREFLEDLVYNVDSTGQPITIMYLMRNENKNLQEALYDVRYNLIKKVNEVNKGFLSEDNNYEGLMKDVYVSPGIKRSLWQALKIVDEVKKIIKQPIDRFFVEVARGGGKKGDRKLSRKLQISSLYKNAKVDKKEIEEMAKKLNLETDNNLRSDKLFYYYMQLGKCMYTNNPIDIDKLNTNAYDIDHIIPRAYLKDDSLNNRVLVERNANALKGDRYPISSDVQDKMKDFWKKLLSVKLITNEKYQRLTRSNDLTDEEKGEFINRQLVFTNQAVKALNEILIKDNPESKIIYSKASNVSIFRQDFGLLKSREINDFHHAHDAYLNIVVGNTYYTKFGTNAIYFFKNQKDKESFVNTNKLFYRNTPSAWNSDGSSKKTVLKMLDLKDILVTKMVTEKKFDFYDETIYPKKDGDKLFPLKTKDTRYLDTNKYGGYKSLKIAYFMIVKHDKGKKSIITIEGMPVIHDYKIKNNELSIQEVLVDYLGLVNPIVLVSKIKAGTLIKLDKAYANLAGKAKNDIITHNANQLYLSQDLTQYFRLIEKYIATQYKKEEIESYALDTYEVSVSKKESEPNPTIDKIKNLKLYDELLYKFQCGLYDGLTMQKLKEELADVRASFKEINVLQQAYSLYELIKIMHCNASTGNLSMFMEKASNKGSNTISKNITDKNITIYDESITGFYRKVRWQNQ